MSSSQRVWKGAHAWTTRQSSGSISLFSRRNGELSNATYDDAWLALGSDERGPFIAACGEYRHTIAFSFDYTARPRVVLHAGETLIDASMTISNLKKTPMDLMYLMYLAHVNFRPMDNARLVYSAPCTTESVKVRTAIPSHIAVPAGHREFLSQLAADPALHNVLKPGLAFDPEVVLYIRYKTDAQGWAHAAPEAGRYLRAANSPSASFAFGTVSSGFTPYQARAIWPFSSMRNDERMIPIEVLPNDVFSPHTP